MAEGKNTLGLFVGAGGMSLGLEQAGHRVIAGVDVWDDALDTYRHNHASVGLQADMHSMEPADLPIFPNQVELIAGGPPCKGFSLAGKRDTDDDRNKLVKRFLDYVEYYEPDAVLMENVVGILSMDTGDGEEVTEYVHRRLSEMGFTSEHRVLDATDYGVPQKRSRVFFLGIRDGEPTFPEPTTPETKQSVSDVLDRDFTGLPNHTFTNHQESTIEKIADTEQGESVYDSYSEAWYRLEPDEPSITVKENHNAPFVHPWEDRVGTPRECAAIQTFPDDYEFKGSKSAVLKQIGNAVPPKLGRVVSETLK